MAKNWFSFSLSERDEPGNAPLIVNAEFELFRQSTGDGTFWIARAEIDGLVYVGRAAYRAPAAVADLLKNFYEGGSVDAVVQIGVTKSQ